MAFQFFTNEKIKAIDIRQIPTSFKGFYESLPEQRKLEIKELRPDLISALFPEAVSNAVNIPMPADENEYTERLMDQWESIPTSAWKSFKIDTQIVVCKVIPNGTERCRIHRRPLENKQLNIRTGSGGTQFVSGKACPECFDFFIEEERINSVAKTLSDREIPALIQPLSMTLQEWKEAVVPVDMEEADPIYVPDSWIENAPTCPICKTSLIPDRYRKSYKGRTAVFDGWHCVRCQKVILRNADAQKLDEQCGDNGIPVSFQPLREEKKPAPAKKKIVPDWVVSNGRKIKSTLKYGDWPVLEEKDTIIISDSPVCRIDGHEDKTDDVPVVIRVEKKRGGLDKDGIEDYLLETGFCRLCGKYYLDVDDFNLLSDEGRLQITLIDDTDTFHSITSGDSFDKERKHLSLVEHDLTREIKRIESLPDYVGTYDVIHYYDEGDLKDRKRRSEHLRKMVDEYTDLKPQPYRYRVDLTNDKGRKTYYLGAEDISINKEKPVVSFNSPFGRKVVNVRTTEIMDDGQKWKIKLRRDFDIQHAVLYGFVEMSDKDAIFRAGITDPFLVKVLNTRKRQHQLVDIISTIQENQNAIVDEPIEKNIIVQGCAGSGKTMVLLHRLSSLKYNQRNYDFSKVIILTPNANFNTHIQNLASSLQIDIITRYSVEEYYRELLQRFDLSLVPGGRIIDEASVNQAYVDFLYSDRFFQFFSQTYESRISDYQKLCYELNEVSARLGRKGISEIPLVGNELFDAIISERDAIEERINMLESDYREASNSLKHAEDRYHSAKNDITEMEGQLQKAVARESLNILAVLERKKTENQEAITNIRASIEEEKTKIAEEETAYHTAAEQLHEALTIVLDSITAELNEGMHALTVDIAEAKAAVEENKKSQIALSEKKERQEALIPEKVRYECEGLLDELLKAEKAWQQRLMSTEQKRKEKEENLTTLNNRIFVTGRAAKREKLHSEIAALQQDEQDLFAEIEEIHRFMQEAAYCEKPDECYSLFHAAEPYLDEKTLIPEILMEQEHNIDNTLRQIASLKSKEQILHENVRINEEAFYELQEIMKAPRRSITADTLPDYIKSASGFLKNPDEYLDMVRPIRREVREHKDTIEASKATIKKLEKQAEERQKTLDLWDSINSREAQEITADNYEELLEELVKNLTEAKIYYTRIQDQERRLKAVREGLPVLEDHFHSAEKRLRKAEESRIDQDTRESYGIVKKKTESLSAKGLYQEVLSDIFDAENNHMEERFKKAFKQTSGTHRFDLYLMLRFAIMFFEKTTGDARLICIDEGQDLTPNEYRLMKKINDGNAVFNIFGDTYQLLKPNRGISNWKAVKDILPYPSEFVLNENYRNTNQITQYCNDYFNMNVLQTGADGREVKEIDRSFLEKALSEFSSEEIRCALILPRAVKKEAYLDQSKLPEKTKRILANSIGRGVIAVVYVDEIKGVEFDTVFVVPNGMTKNEKYIAFTRALSELTVVVDNDIPPASDAILKETVHSEEKKSQNQQTISTFDGIEIGKVRKKKKRKEPARA